MGYYVRRISWKTAQSLVSPRDKYLLDAARKARTIKYVNLARREGRGFHPHIVLVHKNGDYIELAIAKKKYSKALDILYGRLRRKSRSSKKRRKKRR